MDQRAGTERKRLKAQEEEHEARQHFRELYSEARMKQLRKKHNSGELSMEESMSLLMLGNIEHSEKIRDLGVSPQERHERIRSGNADYLVIACSDARIPRLDSEDSPLIGLQIRIAGNVVPKPGTPSFEEMKDAVSNVKNDGLIVVEGHCSCGACKERVKWMESGMKPTGSPELDSLLHEVFGTSPEDNAMAQITKAREKLELGERASGAVVYDWENGGIRIVSDNSSPLMEILVDNWNHRHTEAFEEGGLSQRLSKHKPHAIAVGTGDLPFSLATILHSRQNEVFSTTGSDRGLDDLDKASILYAVEHLGVRHIPFIAPGGPKDRKKIGQMFDRWEEQLRAMSVHGKKVLADLIDSGELKISRLRYDLGNGELKDIG